MKKGITITLLVLVLLTLLVLYPKVYQEGWKRGFGQIKPKAITLFGKSGTNNYSDVDEIEVALPDGRRFSIYVGNVLSDELIAITMRSAPGATNALMKLRALQTGGGGLLVGLVPKETNEAPNTSSQGMPRPARQP
jgi:hypothetical protein